MQRKIICGVFLFLNSLLIQAQRVPVFNQIDLPHNYYYHELYLPQLTSGPSSASWTPDGKALIFSMAGSLWRQHITTDVAEQLTDGDGYDYQADVAADGKTVLFVRYDGSSMELMTLDLATGKESALTQNKSVNLEPRWSPDGKSVAFVSTMNTGHFIPHVATWDGHQLTNVMALMTDQKSEVRRYYYSAFDHGINPAWSRDGKSLYMISNHEIAHGTGDIVSMNLASKEIKTLQHEETSWRARPDPSPDGTRLVYSSYQGRNWQQLWLLPAQGGYAFPLTYGEYDNTCPRWSPDGKQIAFISNRDGNTSLWLVNAYHGGQTQLISKYFRFLQPHSPQTFQVKDENGKDMAARVSITDGREKSYAPVDSWIHSDDSSFPNQRRYEPHYFHREGMFKVHVPAGKLFIQVTKPEYEIAKVELAMPVATQVPVIITLKKLRLPPGAGTWWSGDLHVHMNYTGSYLNTPERLISQAKAENLNFIFNLIVNKEQRIPDISYFSTDPDQASTAENMILHGQEFHTSTWGHLGLLNLRDHLILPDYSGYPQTAAESLFPNNSFIIDLAHAQKALAGYVHPYEIPEIFPDQSPTMTHSLPIDAALGKVDYVELMGFSDHRATEHVWYKLLNCGIRIAAGAGTDAMANYASLRGPVGLNRVYVRGEGLLDKNKFLNSLKAGKSFVTNGPLIGLKIENASPGDSVFIYPKGQSLAYTAFLRSPYPVDHFEIVWNGEVVAKHPLTGSKKSLDAVGKVNVKGPGWLVLHTWSDSPNEDLTDIYAYASTNPVFVGSAGKKTPSKSAAEYFIKWVSRIETKARALTTWRTEDEQTSVLSDIAKAKKYYEKCAQTSTVK